MWLNLYVCYSWFAMNIKFISPIVIFYFYVQKVQTFFFIFIFYDKLNVFALYIQNVLKFARLFLRCESRMSIINISPICFWSQIYGQCFSNGFVFQILNVTFGWKNQKDNPIGPEFFNILISLLRKK